MGVILNSTIEQMEDVNSPSMNVIMRVLVEKDIVMAVVGVDNVWRHS